MIKNAKWLVLLCTKRDFFDEVFAVCAFFYTFVSMKKTVLCFLIVLVELCVNAQTDTRDWHNVQITSCLENEQVHAYMTGVAYPTYYISYNYKTYSKIEKYCNVETTYRKDQPAPVVVPLPERTTEPMILTLADSLHPEEVDTIQIAADVTEVKLWNLIPMRTYYYNVEDLTAGTIHTTGQLRHLRIDSGFNVRDIGGYMTSSGKRLLYGKIYRGSEVDNGFAAEMTAEDAGKLYALGIRTQIDLRLPTNIKGNKLLTESHIGENVEYLPLPMTDNDSLLTKYPHEYKKAFEHIYNTLKKGNAVYVNCTYGADRTGLLCLLIEALCGVALPDLYKEYELSSMANEQVTSDLRRYYTTVNARLCRKLGATNASRLTEKVREYLMDKCEISTDVLDSIVYMMTNDDMNEIAGVNDVNSDTNDLKRQKTCVYSLSGVRMSNMRNGLNLVIKNGKMIKILK